MKLSDIYGETTRHFLTPILPLLDDPSVSEVMVNGPDQIYFERRGKISLSDRTFRDAPSLMAAVRNIAEYVGRQVDEDHPAMDARLPDGSRVHVILAPCARAGACLSIRKFLRAHFDLGKLVEGGSISAEAVELLEMAVLLHKNIVVSGGTGTGKTSLLNALSAKIPESERIIVIEDSSELQLNQPHTIYLEAQPPRFGGRGEVTIRDLFVNSLRMRPDRIVVGEVRRGEALDMVQAMLSGHAGALTTVHASSPRAAAMRLELLCMMSDISLPAHVSRAQVASAVEVVVQLVRLSDGSRRVSQISEVLGLDDANNYLFRDLFRFEARGRDESGDILGDLAPTGERPSFAAEPLALGLADRIHPGSRLFDAE
jgi:pilus assembly protein CpaF